MFHAMATRTCFILGGHTTACARPADFPTEADVSARSNRHLRTLFWLCYSIDKEISFRTGQPPFISNEDCDLTLPEAYSKYTTRTTEPEQEVGDYTLPHVPGDLRLSILKGKVYALLYSVDSQKKSDADLLRDIRELDDEVESWRLTLPPGVRPSLSVPKSIRLTALAKLESRMQRVITHLEYHYLMATIHRASGRCRPWPTTTVSELEQLDVSVRSSLELSVEASRSSMFYLSAAIHELADEVFWLVKRSCPESLQCGTVAHQLPIPYTN